MALSVSRSSPGAPPGAAPRRPGQGAGPAHTTGSFASVLAQVSHAPLEGASAGVEADGRPADLLSPAQSHPSSRARPGTQKPLSAPDRPAPGEAEPAVGSGLPVAAPVTVAAAAAHVAAPALAARPAVASRPIAGAALAAGAGSRPAGRPAALLAVQRPALSISLALRVPGLRGAGEGEAREAPAHKPGARPPAAPDRSSSAGAHAAAPAVPLHAPARTELAAAAQAPEPCGSGLASLPPVLQEAALEDSSLRLTVLPHAASLRVSAPDGGDLSVHVRIRDGVANLTVAGPGSESAMAHSSDLRAALAGQGLALGRIDRASAGPAASPADAAGTRARSKAASQGRGHGDSSSSVEDSGEAPAAESGLARSLQ